MKRFTKLTALMLSFVLLLGGCGFLDMPETTESPFTFEYGYDPEYELIRQGRLVFNITKFWIVDNAAEFPEEDRIPEGEYVSYCIYDENGMGVSMHYPECVQDDGSFAEGVYMVMVEFTVTSENAENWTTSDYFEKKNGNGDLVPRGEYEDPYIFGMNMLGLFWAGNACASSRIAYFSQLNEVSHSPWSYAFRVEPGETRTMVVGYFINIDDSTGEPYDVNELTYKARNNGRGTVSISVGDLLVKNEAIID